VKRARAALYHRVSTIDQHPAAARKELRAAARRHGMRVVLDVEETGSGATSLRPGLQRVLSAARKGELDAVLCWKLDRFGRSTIDLLHHLRELESSGVRFLATTQGIDIRPGADPIAHLLLTMLSAVAQFERSVIVERTHLGLAHARTRGVRLGRPPALFDIVQARKMRAQGWTLDEIAWELDVGKGTIYRALSSPKRGTPTGAENARKNGRAR